MADEKYKELVNKRMAVALAKIELVKKMTASNNYKPDADDVEKIVMRIHAEAEALASAFDSRSKKTTEIEPVL